MNHVKNSMNSRSSMFLGVKTGVLFHKFYMFHMFHMLESLFSRVAGLQLLSNFISKRLQHRCFAVKLAKFLRTPIWKNNCERLLLF